MKKLINIQLIVLLLVLSACKKYETYEVSGIALNKYTREPLAGVKVTLEDGLGQNNAFIESDEITATDLMVTGVDGAYHVKIKTEANHAILRAGNENYGFKTYDEGGSTSGFKIVGEGKTCYNLEMEGRAYFKAYLKKNIGLTSIDDTLKFVLLAYDDLNYNLGTSPYIYKGVGFFEFPLDSEMPVTGDRFLRYKLEWTNNGIWNSKIDSVFVPTSQEIFRDTIYY